MRKLIILILSVLIIASVCIYFFTMKQPELPKEMDLITEIVQSYARTEGAADVSDKLAKLSAVNAETGAKWKQIMEYWDYANHSMPVHTDEIPDDLDGAALCIVVLGFQLAPDGNMLPELIGRLETALTFAEQYPDSVILCTGGGTAQHSSNTEAGEMGKWLEANGISTDRILLETASRDTAQNAIFSYSLLREAHPERSQIAIVSSDYHIPWGTVLFQAKCILAGEKEPDVQVVTNAALKTSVKYPIYNAQSSGLLSIARKK